MSNGSFWHGVVTQFGHVTQQIARDMAPQMKLLFGLEPASTLQLAEVLMHAHAGNADARQQIESLAQQPGLKQAMMQLAVALRQHPHFAHFQVHAANEKKKLDAQPKRSAAPVVVGIRRRRVGGGHVSGTV